ncbi:MAG: hypothetical protein AAFV29_24485 [Myxococcota bacterium]
MKIVDSYCCWILALSLAQLGTACTSSTLNRVEVSPQNLLSTADEVLQRWVDVRSHPETGELPTTIIAEQVARLSSANLKARAETLIDYGATRMMQHVASQRMGSVFSGIVDDKYFSTSVLFGTYTKEGPAKELYRRLARHDSDFRERYAVRSYVGIESIDGRACYRLKLIARGQEDYPIDRWFDVKSGVLIQETTGRSSEGLRLPITVRFDDYRRIDGFLIPFQQVSTFGPYDIELTTTAVRTNVALSRERFVPPDFAATERRVLGQKVKTK